VLHFTTKAEWEIGQKTGQYRPHAMAEEGFIHLSFGHQLAWVATDLARGSSDLVLLVVDPAGLEPDLRVEGGFPHLYRPIPVESVRLVVDLPPREDGSFETPEQARLAELAMAAFPSVHSVLVRSRSVMTGFARSWWIGGGWAVDAATGTISRPHLDVDLVVLRPDVPALGSHLAGWDLRLARAGTLREWDGGGLAESDHQVWARRDDGIRPERWQDFAADPGFVEFLAEEVDVADGMWVYRRDPVVRAPLSRLGTPGGFLRPEVALLYKAAAAGGGDPLVSAKAQFDFQHALAHLDRDQREWLTTALRRAHPGHPWTSSLNS